MIVSFDFSDIGKNYYIHLRRGVAEVRAKSHPAPDIRVTVTSTVWKEILARVRNPAVAFASDDIQVDGSLLDLVGFLQLFQPES